MTAVWRTLNGNSPPPPELIIGLDWRNFGTPYVAGGLRDQPIRLYRAVKEALYYYDAFSVWMNKPDLKTAEQMSAWNKRNADIVKLVNRVIKHDGKRS